MGPVPVQDLHDGGAVMWIGGAAVMFVAHHHGVLRVEPRSRRP